MPTLTRRDRVAQGANQGGALKYGAAHRWPLPAPGVFELFAINPASRATVADPLTHYIRGITSWAGDGTTKLYMGYGSISANLAPIHIVPLNLNGTWDATVWDFNAFALQRFVHFSTGEMLATGIDGPSDWVRAIPGSPPVWIDGWCTPAGYKHPMSLVEHDGYVWVSGGGTLGPGFGSVWRGKHITGNDGEFVLGSEFGWFNTCLFSYQGKLWFQPYYGDNGVTPTFLRYWVEASKSWVVTTIDLNKGAVLPIEPWGSLMLMLMDGKMYSFNGTTATLRYTSSLGGINDFCVDASNNVWLVEGNASTSTIRRSSDLVTWKVVAQFPEQSYSIHVLDGIMYLGDRFDSVWRGLPLP